MRGIARAAIARWKPRATRLPPPPPDGPAADGWRTLICAASVTAQLRYDVHVDDFKPEIGDPSHEPAEGSLIWQLGAKGCRAGAGTDLAVVEFRAQRGARLARESDLICL